MIASKTLFVLFTAVAAVSARVVPRKQPPAGWWTEGMEDYDAYHTRYLALGCQNQHGKAFFDACCHPLKKDETLETARAPECIPSASASASASLAEPTSTVTTPDDVPAVSPTSATPSPISNVASGDDSDDDDTCDPEDEDGDNEGDDGDDEDCEDDGEDEDGSSSSAPEETSSTAAAPTPTFTPAPSPTPAAEHTSPHNGSSKASNTKTSEAPESTSGSSDSSGQTITGGFATFYFQNGNAGACGDFHSDSDLIAAMDSRRYGNTGAKSELCGKQVKITNTDNGKEVVVTIADACPTCTNENSIDLSSGAFDKIADRATGMVPIKWQLL